MQKVSTCLNNFTNNMLHMGNLERTKLLPAQVGWGDYSFACHVCTWAIYIYIYFSYDIYICIYTNFKMRTLSKFKYLWLKVVDPELGGSDTCNQFGGHKRGILVLSQLALYSIMVWRCWSKFSHQHPETAHTGIHFTSNPSSFAVWCIYSPRSCH